MGGILTCEGSILLLRSPLAPGVCVCIYMYFLLKEDELNQAIGLYPVYVFPSFL